MQADVYESARTVIPGVGSASRTILVIEEVQTRP